MDTQNIIVKADIRRNPSKKRNVILKVYLVVLAASLILGLIDGSWSKHYDAGTTYLGRAYPEKDVLLVGWRLKPFGLVKFYDYDSAESYTTELFGYKWTSYGEDTDWYTGNIILFTLLYLIAAATPFVVKALYARMCKNTELFVTDEQVFGSYNSFIFKKTLQIPIEKVDNLTIISTFLDKLRTGKTLGVCSASGVIKLHFVQNAEDVVSLTMERINEIKNKEKRARIIAQTAATIPTTVSTADKLKELASMKEAGLLSEDEYANKREELLAKM